MSKTFLRWLARFPTKREAVYLVIGFFIADFVWSYLMSYAYSAIGVAVPPTLDPSVSIWAAMGGLLLVAIGEELVFRIIPLAIFIKEWGIGWGTLRALLVSSLFFGLIHGDIRNLLLQGVSGMMFGILFIKFSDRGNRLSFASVVVIATHFLFDLWIYVLYHLLVFMHTI
jgi:membrane protease YdiL (CAAX protease family)